MNIQRVQAVLETPTEQTIRALLDDESAVFWVDWREDDETIADACERVLGTGCLSGELVETDAGEGHEVYIRYGARRVRVPLTYTEADRHVTLCALNEALAPEYEVRFCIDSNGGDTLAFLPLPAAQWTELEQRYSSAVGARFYRIAARTTKPKRTAEQRAEEEAIRRQHAANPIRQRPTGAINPQSFAAILRLVARFKAVRESQGLTLAEVAGRMGIDPPALSRLETGKVLNPTLATLHKWAEALGQKLDIDLSSA